MAKSKKKPVNTGEISHPTPVVPWRIQPIEYLQRIERVRRILEQRKLDGLVLFHPIRMAYTTGFYHLSTERPMAIVVSRNGGVGALVPHLEEEHIGKATGVTNVEIYPEYQTGGGQHPMLHLVELLKTLGLNQRGVRLGADSNGYLDVMGYNGPLLSEVVAGWVEVSNERDIVDRLRAIKSPEEIRLMIESCVWGNLAHRLMHDAVEVGRSALDISFDACAAASKAMVAALGPGYQALTNGWSSMPANVSFVAGSNTSMPHGLDTATTLREGDVLVTVSSSDVGGYHSELERTMILGEPTKEFTKYFGIMMTLQQTAFDAIRPGRTFAEIETEVSKAHKDLGVEAMQRHHSGHGLGLEAHEWPFIDKGSDDVVEENMILSVEPGIYVPGLAGFRHSDTVVVRKDGVERLTFYPRELSDMTIPVR